MIIQVIELNIVHLLIAKKMISAKMGENVKSMEHINYVYVIIQPILERNANISVIQSVELATVHMMMK
ncbi:hypothetical protein MXB_4842 [Myxobolus squamalis]|nr:hypothetical protein MXB_4842 [Myxobolus squamalis]